MPASSREDAFTGDVPKTRTNPTRIKAVACFPRAESDMIINLRYLDPYLVFFEVVLGGATSMTR